MTPNILKENSSLPNDPSDPNHPRNKAAYQTAQGEGSDESKASSAMDGDHSAKSMDAGAGSALNATDMGDGIHEDAQQTVRV